MNISKYNFLFILLAGIFTFSSCGDDPQPEDPEEVITTLIYTLTPVSGGNNVVLTFRDIDGDGGNAPDITGGTLATNTVYQGAITLSNESEDPAEDITAEVRDEDLDHQFFFSSSLSDLNVTYSDTDPNGNPIGLATSVSTGAAGNGTLTVILRHQPDKNAAGVRDGEILNAGGETDIEVIFDVTVE